MRYEVKRMYLELLSQGYDRKSAICKTALAEGLTVQTVLNITKGK